jgi:protein-arginine kinase activator protein McsA
MDNQEKNMSKEKKHFTWAELDDAQKIAIAETIFMEHGIDVHRSIFMFSNGKGRTKIRDLDEELQNAIDNDDFEKAAILRDEMKKLKK